MSILGVDGATRVTGWAVVEDRPSGPYRVASGLINTKKTDTTSERLRTVADELQRLMVKFDVEVMVLERAFVGPNIRTCMKLSEMRGACMLEGHRHGARYYEYHPSTVRKLIGLAKRPAKGEAKKDVSAIMQLVFGVHDNLAYDETDALALALAFIKDHDGD